MDAHSHDLQQIVGLITAVAEPERIILFGSHARGDAGPASDIDLLVILSDDADRWETSRVTRMEMVRRRVTTPVELLFQTRSEFDRRRRKPGHLFWTVDREGRELHAA